MKLEINLRDEDVDALIETLESLVGGKKIVLDMEVNPRATESKKEYIKNVLNKIVKDALKKAGEHKEYKKYNDRLASVTPLQPAPILNIEVL